MFVDNIKVIGIKESSHIKKVKHKLVTVFEIVDIRPISFYLGLKIKRDSQNKILKLS